MQIDKKSLVTIVNFSKENHHIRPIFFHTGVIDHRLVKIHSLHIKNNNENTLSICSIDWL